MGTRPLELLHLFGDLNNISGFFLMVPIDEHGESNMTKSNLLFSGKLSPFKFLISG